MPQSLASRRDFPALAAAMSRHPASGGRGSVTALFGPDLPGGPAVPADAGAASFATVAALLTGRWRVDDPDGFAAAMRAAPLVAGYPVVDLGACVRHPTGGLDPLSVAAAGRLESAAAGAAERSGLVVRWVAARAGADLYVEAAARAPADGEGPELLVLGHLVEPLAGAAPAGDDSWLLAVVGDGQGGVAGIARALLDRRLPRHLRLGALRARLARAALAAEGLGPHPTQAGGEGVVVPFRR